MSVTAMLAFSPSMLVDVKISTPNKMNKTIKISIVFRRAKHLDDCQDCMVLTIKPKRNQLLTHPPPPVFPSLVPQ